ncbi:MAG: hypothetical protein PHV02_11165 [Rhodocyclaceae bacterium]|nr:hypothetical protein [Rhodocyclaceae bacterium]
MVTAKKAGLDGQAPTPARARPVKRVDTALEAINAKNKQALSEALSKAQAVQIPPPPVSALLVQAADKPGKGKKSKLIRDGFAMPEHEYAAIASLKRRLLALGQPAKKSEIIRGGIALLMALNDVELQAAMGEIERIKTGRPKK